MFSTKCKIVLLFQSKNESKRLKMFFLNLIKSEFNKVFLEFIALLWSS